MRPLRIGLALAFLLAARPAAVAQAPSGVQWDGVVTEHAGPCDASGAVAVPEGGLDPILVANDEREELTVISSGQAPAPAGADLRAYLGTMEREADLEAAAWLGGRAFWIASHGRNAQGELRPTRQQFFATTLAPRGGVLEIRPVPTPDGKPVRTLLPALRQLPLLAAAIGTERKDPALAPERGGLNIEGLAAGRDGRSLLLGLRNPLAPGGRAILVPLQNPAELLGGAAPALGAPILLDLGGRGVRSIDLAPAAGIYLIVAGPVAGGRDFELFRWAGEAGRAPEPLGAGPVIAVIPDFRPEALVTDAAGRRLRLLSDDGDRPMPGAGGKPCKEVSPRSAQRFRSILLEIR